MPKRAKIKFPCGSSPLVEKTGSITSIRQLEALLRDAGGLSRTKAKKVASGGWPALNPKKNRDDSADLDNLAAIMQRAINVLSKERTDD